MSTHKRRLTRRRVLGAGALGVAATGAAVAGGTGLLSTASAAGFGHSDDGKNFVVDTGANLVFKVSKATGDLTSLRYKGKEYEGYGGRHSHVESGLGASTVTIHGDTVEQKFFDRKGPSGWYSQAWMSRALQSLSRPTPNRCSSAAAIGIDVPSELGLPT